MTCTHHTYRPDAQPPTCLKCGREKSKSRSKIGAWFKEVIA